MRLIVFLFFSFTLLSCTDSNNDNIGFFSKQFGEKQSLNQKEQTKSVKDSFNLTKTAEMIDEVLYWSIVDKSLKNTNNQYDQERFLIKEIGKLTPKEMIGFRLRTDKFLYDTYSSEMWCAGYIMNGGCSDDGFEYFRNWVISRGKGTYYKAKENPDFLINELTDGMKFYEFESFWYVSLVAFKSKTSKDLYDYIDYNSFNADEGSYPQFEFTWQEENPESMKKICPQLFDKFWD